MGKNQISRTCIIRSVLYESDQMNIESDKQYVTGLPNNKEEQEDLVIASYIEHLNANGIQVEFIESPDRLKEGERSRPLLTSDGLLCITTESDQKFLSVDVMGLASDHDPYQEMKVLMEGLREISNARKVNIFPEGTVPSIPEIHEILAELERVISTAPQSGEWTISESLYIRWSRPEGSSQPEVGGVLMTRMGSGDLVAQVVETISKPLLKKGQIQAKRAVDSGCSAIVLLDRQGHERIEQGMHWVPKSVHTFKTAVEIVLSRAEHFIESVWLRDQTGDWHLIYRHD